MFLEKGSGAHFRTGFYTDSYLQYTDGNLINQTQVLWTIGLGVSAFTETKTVTHTEDAKITKTVYNEILRIEASLTDSFLMYYIANDDNNKIETIQLSAEYKF